MAAEPTGQSDAQREPQPQPEPQNRPKTQPRAGTRPKALLGIDEAGYGPLLGPLVVGGVMVSGPEGADPWALLAPAVARRPTRPRKGDLEPIVVADSKLVHRGPKGPARLECTALTALAATGEELPQDLRGWLMALGVDPEPLAACPWYGALELPLPLHQEREHLAIRGAWLARAAADRGIRIEHLRARVLDAAEFNRSIQATDNKSRTHFAAYGEVLRGLATRAPAGAHLVADRCGGRMRYRNDLRRLFPGRPVAVEREHPVRSTYRVGTGDGIRVTFAAGGEEQCFATALSSCLAKYTRQLLMAALNGWFAERVPGLRPTAGYVADGRRFLQDLAPHWEALGLDRDALVRSR